MASIRCLRALVLAAAASAVSGCAVNTPYRYTAVVPAARPLAWDGRTGHRGSLRVEGTLTRSGIVENLAPIEHDTAVRVPGVTAEGAAMLALSSGLELGVRGAYASYGWTTPSAYGTEPLPSHPGSWGIGPELRGTIPIGTSRRFAIGLAGNVMNYTVPYAEWSRTGPDSPNGRTDPCVPSSTCTVDASTGGHYRLFSERSEGHWTTSFGVYPSVGLGDDGEYGRVFALFGGHTGFKNDGFTDRPTNGSTVETTAPIWIVGGGYAVDAGLLHAGALVYRPLGASDSSGEGVAYSLGGMLTLGLNIDLTEAAPGTAAGEAP